MKVAEFKTKKLGRCPLWVVLALAGVAIVILIALIVLFFVLTRPGGEEIVEEPYTEVVEEASEEEQVDDTEELENTPESEEEAAEEPEVAKQTPSEAPSSEVGTSAASGNCTLGYGNLMLINANFTVDSGFISARRGQLVSLSQNYGIPEYKASNGDNLLVAEAAAKLNEMVQAYQTAFPGHQMGTRSCFRAQGTSCGRLCAATGTSDHHTGLTCDLIDQAYGNELDTDYYANHLEWQWLRENSYRYGFIDRYPATWAGGSMAEPMNVDANGTTGYYESWHYRYVGVQAATEIATGKYNGGRYDSLEHYLKVTGRVADLVGGRCQ